VPNATPWRFFSRKSEGPFAAALKTVNKKGIDAVLADARSNGFTTK
jgi:ribosomal protein L28